MLKEKAEIKAQLPVKSLWPVAEAESDEDIRLVIEGDSLRVLVVVSVGCSVTGTVKDGVWLKEGDGVSVADSVLVATSGGGKPLRGRS